MAFIMNVKVLKSLMFKRYDDWYFYTFTTNISNRKNINGSKSWINLGFMNLQASELLKISIILYIPFMIEKKMPAVRHNIKLILGPILFVVTCLILVLFQKDVGQTMLIVIIFFSIIFTQVSVCRIC